MNGFRSLNAVRRYNIMIHHQQRRRLALEQHEAKEIADGHYSRFDPPSPNTPDYSSTDTDNDSYEEEEGRPLRLSGYFATLVCLDERDTPR